MKPSTKAKLAAYINFACFLVETAVGVCVAILMGYELVLEHVWDKAHEEL